MCSWNEDGQAKSHVESVVMNVSRLLRRRTDSVKAIGLSGTDEITTHDNATPFRALPLTHEYGVFGHKFDQRLKVSQVSSRMYVLCRGAEE